MTQIKTASIRMPFSGLSGVTLGGNAWFQKNFTIADPGTWDGIVIDPDGSFLGSSNIGITVWDNAVKRVQINSGGMAIIGGESIWAPDGWDIQDGRTWDGFIVNNDGIRAYQVKNGTWDVDSDGGLMPSSDTSAQGTPKLKISIDVNGLVVYGGAGFWVPENFDGNDKTTWNGVVLDWSGLSAYRSGSQCVKINQSGITIGKDGGPQLIYDAVTGLMTVPAISTDILAAGSLVSGTGVLLSSMGLATYNGGIQTALFSNTGNVTIGKAGGPQLIYDAVTGVMSVPAISTDILAAGSLTSGTGVLLSSMGLATYNGGIQTALFSNTGNVTIGKDGGPQLIYNSTTGIMALPAISTDILAAGSLTSGNGVLLDSSGLSLWASSTKKVQLDQYGITIIGGTSVPFTIQTTDFSISAKTGSVLAITFGANTGKTNARIDAAAFPGGGADLAWNDLRLQSYGGYVTIGNVATPAARLHINTSNINGIHLDGSADNSSSVTIMKFSAYGNVWEIGARGSGASAPASGFYIYSNTNNAYRFYITSTGVVCIPNLAGTGNRAVYSDSSGNLTNSSSDQNLKTNISDIAYGLSEVLKMRPVSFNWKQSAILGDQREIGFVAQDIEKLVPEVVGMNSDGMRSLDYPKITAVLCRAIQEQQEQINALKTRIDAIGGA